MRWCDSNNRSHGRRIRLLRGTSMIIIHFHPPSNNLRPGGSYRWGSLALAFCSVCLPLSLQERAAGPGTGSQSPPPAGLRRAAGSHARWAAATAAAEALAALAASCRRRWHWQTRRRGDSLRGGAGRRGLRPGRANSRQPKEVEYDGRTSPPCRLGLTSGFSDRQLQSPVAFEPRPQLHPRAAGRSLRPLGTQCQRRPID